MLGLYAKSRGLGMVLGSRTAVQISQDPYFGGASWRAASGSAGWELGEREGAQTLYVRFRDGSGLESPPFERTVEGARGPSTR